MNVSIQQVTHGLGSVIYCNPISDREMVDENFFWESRPSLARDIGDGLEPALQQKGTGRVNTSDRPFELVVAGVDDVVENTLQVRVRAVGLLLGL